MHAGWCWFEMCPFCCMQARALTAMVHNLTAHLLKCITLHCSILLYTAYTLQCIGYLVAP